MFECEYCHMEMISESSLVYHKKNCAYKNKEKLICSFCKKEYFKKDNLRVHENNCRNKVLKKELTDIRDQIEKIKNEIKIFYEKINFLSDDFFNFKLMIENKIETIKPKKKKKKIIVIM